MASTKTAENGTKKSATKKAAPKAATAASAGKSPASRKKTSAPAITTSASRLQMIEEAAYYIAEKSGFNNQQLEHWLAAEKQVDGQLNA